MKLLWQLCREFFKTGLFAVGGGLATIPFLAEMSEKYHWFDREMLTAMIALSESTPGPIGINMATYVGATVKGISGALVSTLSLVLPSLLIICFIARFLPRFKDNKWVKAIFSGIKPAVVAFILSACLSIFLKTFFRNNSYKLNYKCIFLFLTFLLFDRYFKRIHPIIIILSAAVIGVIFAF